ncbi:MAG: pilus assembly protein N-terminal domain-containing protein [Myxococcaceae bacterium]
MSARLILAVLGGVLLLAPVVELTSTEAFAQGPVAVTVKVGGSKTISVSDVARIAVANPDVADIRVDGGKHVKITGRAPGSTTVLVWMQDGQKVTWSVTVTP